MNTILRLPTELDTPWLLVDAGALERNLHSMAVSARRRSLRLRPHVKTHKCIEIARRQLDLGAAGLTVATVSEAEVFARAGCTDLFIAYPVWAAGARGHRLRELAGQVNLRIGLDSPEGAAVLAQATAGTEVEVLVEVDSGHHRTGVAPERAGEVAVAAVRAGLRVVGISPFLGTDTDPALGSRRR